MTNPSQAAPPSTPTAPPTSAPAAKPGVATLSRELADFLVELSITLNKHAIYPQSHPLLDIAVDGVATRLAMLFVGDRDSLSIGVARRQLIIEGVATDPLNPVLKELAQRLQVPLLATADNVKDFFNEDANGAHTPGFHRTASELLAHDRDILGVGVETVGTDAGKAHGFKPPFPAHNLLHGAGKFGLASLRNLERLPPMGALLITPPLKIEKGSGSPLRVLALVPV